MGLTLPKAWPGALQTVARLLGDEAAAAVARGLGGRRHYLSAVPGRDDPLAKIVGVRGARLVAAALRAGRGEAVEWPTARTLLTAIEAERLRREGRSLSEIARQLHMSERQATRLVSHIPKGNGAPGDEAEPEPARCALCGRPHRPRTVPRTDGRQLALPWG